MRSAQDNIVYILDIDLIYKHDGQLDAFKAVIPPRPSLELITDHSDGRPPY